MTIEDSIDDELTRENAAISEAPERGGTMHAYDVDSLRLLASERHDQRLREADAERLARESRSTRRHGRRLRLRAGLAPRSTHLQRLRRLES